MNELHPPLLQDRTLMDIEKAIIESSGDGELAAYVVRYLMQEAEKYHLKSYIEKYNGKVKTN